MKKERDGSEAVVLTRVEVVDAFNELIGQLMLQELVQLVKRDGPDLIVDYKILRENMLDILASNLDLLNSVGRMYIPSEPRPELYCGAKPLPDPFNLHLSKSYDDVAASMSGRPGFESLSDAAKHHYMLVTSCINVAHMIKSPDGHKNIVNLIMNRFACACNEHGCDECGMVVDVFNGRVEKEKARSKTQKKPRPDTLSLLDQFGMDYLAKLHHLAHLAKPATTRLEMYGGGLPFPEPYHSSLAEAFEQMKAKDRLLRSDNLYFLMSVVSYVQANLKEVHDKEERYIALRGATEVMHRYLRHLGQMRDGGCAECASILSDFNETFDWAKNDPDLLCENDSPEMDALCTRKMLDALDKVCVAIINKKKRDVELEHALDGHISPQKKKGGSGSAIAKRLKEKLAKKEETGATSTEDAAATEKDLAERKAESEKAAAALLAEEENAGQTSLSKKAKKVRLQSSPARTLTSKARTRSSSLSTLTFCCVLSLTGSEQEEEGRGGEEGGRGGTAREGARA